MNPLLVFCLTVLGSYLIGGIPFGYLVARWRGVDIFAQGSGNIGATNVGRVLGRRYGILVFVLDFAKGALPVTAAVLLGRALENVTLTPDVFGVGAGLAAFLGHLFSPYLGFRGGKGVATGAGVVLVLFPLATAAAVLAWGAVVAGTRTVSLASLTAAVVLCVVHLGATPAPFAEDTWVLSAFCLLAAALVVARHRANIGRLLQGTENRLPESPTMHQLTKTVHVLALGLWFGSAVFFLLIATPTIFATFDRVGAQYPRPPWFPLKETVYDYKDGQLDGPREQGSRAAGAAVAPLFPLFFLLQGACGLLATATSLGWSRSRPQDTVHRVRTWLLLAALITVVASFPIENRVRDLRDPRNVATDAYLERGSDSEAIREAFREKRGQFFTWHLASLSLSFVTLLLVTGAMALAARLPEHRPSLAA